MASESGPVEDAVRVGGLAEIKVARIKTILQTLVEERGTPPTMEYLRGMSDENAKAELTRFKGVGPKTASCVLMFCLDRNDFPVDTHVWHIAHRLGWVPPRADREQTYEHLNRRVPDDVKFGESIWSCRVPPQRDEEHSSVFWCEFVRPRPILHVHFLMSPSSTPRCTPSSFW